MKIRTISSVLCLSFLTACAAINSKEKPLLHEAAFLGNHAELARCTVRGLSSDARAFIRIFHIKSRLYPDIAASEIHAYDTRFLPYIYASNSPQNPDGIRDFTTPSPEIMTDTRQLAGAEYIYGFAFTLRQTDQDTVTVSLTGNPFVGEIAWNYLQGCVANQR